MPRNKDLSARVKKQQLKKIDNKGLVGAVFIYLKII